MSTTFNVADMAFYSRAGRSLAASVAYGQRNTHVLFKNSATAEWRVPPPHAARYLRFESPAAGQLASRALKEYFCPATEAWYRAPPFTIVNTTIPL